MLEVYLWKAKGRVDIIVHPFFFLYKTIFNWLKFSSCLGLKPRQTSEKWTKMSTSLQNLKNPPDFAFPQFLYKIKNPSEQNLSKPL